MATYLMAKGNSGDIVKRQKNWIIRSKATNIKKITAIYEYYIKQYPINIHNHRLSFDFFIPSYSCLIEFDGIQHFFPFEHFGGKKRFEKQREYDSFKNNYCKERNIKLVRIKYSDSDKEIYNKLS